MTLRSMPTHFDSKEAILITANIAFHKGTKLIEIDYHFISDKVLMKLFPHQWGHYQTSLLTSSKIESLMCCMIA